MSRRRQSNKCTHQLNLTWSGRMGWMDTFRNNLFVPKGDGCKEMFYLKRTPALIEPVDIFDHVHSPLSTIDIQTHAYSTRNFLIGLPSKYCHSPQWSKNPVFEREMVYLTWQDRWHNIRTSFLSGKLNISFQCYQLCGGGSFFVKNRKCLDSERVKIMILSLWVIGWLRVRVCVWWVRVQVRVWEDFQKPYSAVRIQPQREGFQPTRA